MTDSENNEKSDALPESAVDDTPRIESTPITENAGEERTTEHGVDEYLPAPKADRKEGIALCLSGGGFRAALFHLGAARRLNELGILSQVHSISSVSGGSVFSAHLAQCIPVWPAPGELLPDWDAQVAEPFRRFAGTNIRTVALLSRLRHFNDPAAPIKKLAVRYDTLLKGMRLADLPQHPRFIFCATDMVFGTNWTFERERVGDYMVGHMPTPQDWPLAMAVAASSCFPPVFEPLPLELKFGELKGGSASEEDRRALTDKVHLTDGGVYDNMGLEPVWKKAGTVLVSDGGAKFSYEWEKSLPGRILRYTSVQGNQASAVRKRWLIASFISSKSNGPYGKQYGMEGVYWGIASATSHYTAHKSDPAPRGYREDVVRERIAPIRTDFDAFTKAEIAVLENHGYLLADAAIKRHLQHLIKEDAELRPPHGKDHEKDYENDEWVCDNLKDTGRRILGRPFPALPFVDHKR